MRSIRRVVVVLVVAALLASCGGGDGGAEGSGSDTAEIDAQAVDVLSEDEAAAMAAAVNAFGFDLHRVLVGGADGEGANVVTSPLSVAVLLAMVAAGAGGETAAQMAEVLHLDQARDPRMAALLRHVADTADVTLSVANALWANDGVPFEEDYVTFVRRVFGATIEEAPLGAPETAEAIDDWVVERTRGLIEGIADDLGLPDPSIVLVLVNAVYFLGEWSVQFDPELTSERGFTLGDGTLVEIPTMYRPVQADGPVELARRDGYEVLRLSYGDEQRYAMEVFLPDVERDLAWLLDRLDPGERREAIAELEPTSVDVVLPRFELEWEAELNDVLVDLGMDLPFGPGADFSPMSPAAPWLDVVVHKTYVRVDEQGTEAAAVTGGAMTTSMPPSFTVDRPFLFTITDTQTDTVLFLGSVTDPR
jgi:serine protease inhibitor